MILGPSPASKYLLPLFCQAPSASMSVIAPWKVSSAAVPSGTTIVTSAAPASIETCMSCLRSPPKTSRKSPAPPLKVTSLALRSARLVISALAAPALTVSIIGAFPNVRSQSFSTSDQLPSGIRLPSRSPCSTVTRLPLVCTLGFRSSAL